MRAWMVTVAGEVLTLIEEGVADAEWNTGASKSVAALAEGCPATLFKPTSKASAVIARGNRLRMLQLPRGDP
jgi:hypothetical protein